MSAKINHASINVIAGLYATADERGNMAPVWAYSAAQVIKAGLFSAEDAVLDICFF